METVKPGIGTTEFWVTVLNLILQMLVAFGILNTAGADELAALIAPVILAVIPLIVYIWGRVKIKSRM